MAPLAIAPAAAETAFREQWEVEFARFFTLPWRRGGDGDALPAAARSPLAKRRSADAASILSVSVGDDLYEEHFVSNLHFSWPQVSCVAECPVRGSRVVFFSYRDSSSQIQKFAVRFASYSIVEAFLSCVKDCLRDVMDIALPGNDLVCENSSLSEYTASNGLHYKFDEESSFEKPIAAYPLNMRASSDNGERSQQSLQPEFDNNIETFSSGLPPSFTELLHNSLTYTREALIYRSLWNCRWQQRNKLYGSRQS
ncbi:protein POOR HOMOLOGOUS SYNAPSIS 1-like isoform X2 [Ananas comosus]|uniref:Protein POOR HOMOLOGOUS SYNAPSIS 1-like isoform X2 n=1 Tax=Ananas comosus TaxID=4615 RepID=A0A6P5FNF2_ANACO|nr:protein POOR HOMOLOGOUS SYNAPSIS 1-like isoform X2 [Ananas comosus]